MGLIKLAAPCLQAGLWHSKEGVSFTDNTFMDRQYVGLPCCLLCLALPAEHA